MNKKVSVISLVAMLILSLTTPWVTTSFSREISPVRATGSIRGTIVCDAAGPVAGAVVAIPAVALKSTTDSAGAFRIQDIKTGTYAITVSVNNAIVKILDNVTVYKNKATDVGTVGITCSKICNASQDCPAGNYCSRAEGTCGSPGKCEPTPPACLQVYDPVCGCDGSTLPNACTAAQMGVSVLYKGACQIIPPPPVSCTDNNQCGSGEYCVKTEGSCSTQGTCGTLPAASCSQVYDPVCGCNGSTYANECEAAVAGVTIAARGACVVPPPQPVACLSNTECAAGEFCAKGLGECSAQGLCTQRPSLCVHVIDPVCGCNGITYSNDCEAAAAGIAVSHKGTCAVPPPPIGCLTNFNCLSTQYCAKSNGNCAGTGSCKPRPDYCIMWIVPVIGCDGRTYNNSCEAASAGVNLLLP